MTCRRARSFLVLAAILGSTAALCTADAPPAGPTAPVDLVPANALLCWSGAPWPEAGALDDARPSTLQAVLEIGTRLSGQNLGAATQLTLRGAEFFGLLIRCEHAIAVLDARAKPLERDPAAQRVDRLCVAVVVRTGGHNEPFLRLIQKTVNEQTNAAEAELAPHTAAQWTYQELHDRRLPEWAALAWGTIGDHFVLTLGPDVWPRVAAVAAGEATPISADPWFAESRGPVAGRALLEVFVAVEEIRTRLDAVTDGRATDFFIAWDAPGLTQAHWALGFEGPALFCRAAFRIAGETYVRTYADAANRDPRWLDVVPEGARYAIYALPTDRFLRRLANGLIATQGPAAGTNIRRHWQAIQERGKFDAQRDLLDNLGEHIVLHNFPPHPLRLPLAMTALIEIKSDPAGVRRAVEAACAGWRDVLEDAARRADKTPDYTLVRYDDGVWCLRLGIFDGPAWTVTERFVLLSWSPAALREAREKAGARLNERPGVPV